MAEQAVKKAAAKYKYKDLVAKDCLTLLRTYSCLVPKTDSYVFNDGTSRELMCLDGTIPVQYKGRNYNIPVALWMKDKHPYEAPLCFVKPTSNMLVRANRHVDANGLILLPYLHNWKYGKSDLVTLAQIMATAFSEEMPVFSRTSSQANIPPPRPQYPPPGGALPYPSGGPGFMPMPGGGPAFNPYQNTGQYPGQYSHGGYPGGYPPSTTSQTPYTPYPASTYTPYGGSGYSQGYPSGQPGHSQQNSLSEDQIKASLVSAVEDKIKRRLKETFIQAGSEMEALKRTQGDLNRGARKLDDMIQSLESQIEKMDRNVQLLAQKDEELNDVIQKTTNQTEELNIDEAVVPTAPLYKQLLNIYAEESALEDTIYYLGEALRRGVIDLEVFLKQVRSLARKQFMLRALMQKARQKAGLRDL